MKVFLKYVTSCLLAMILMVTLVPVSFGYADMKDEPKAKSIEIGEVKMIEGNRGVPIYPEDGGEPWMNYDFEWVAFDYAVIMEDGTKISSTASGTVNYQHVLYRPTVTVEQSAENPLVLGGTYPATLSIFGIEKEFNITIIENPFVSLEMVEPSYEIVENTHGFFIDNGEYYYDLRQIIAGYKATTRDGKVYYSDERLEHALSYEGVIYDLSVFEKEAKPDGYTQIICWNNLSTPYTVKLLPNPIASVDVPGVRMAESELTTVVTANGSVIAGLEYMALCNTYKVTLKDGTVLESDTDGSITYKNSKYHPSGDQEFSGDDILPKPGKNRLKFSIMGVDFGVDVIIVCNNHTWDDGTITKEATHMIPGERTYTCTVCEETKKETVIKQHVFDKEQYLADETGHWNGCSCGAATPVSPHHFGSGYICDTCGYEDETLKQMLNQEGTPEAPAVHAHLYKNVITKATATKNGSIVKKCDCGKVVSKSVIYKVSGIKLKTTSYVYNGKKKADPKITVRNSKGQVISLKYYTISKPAKPLKEIGKYTYIVKFKGDKYKGTKKLTLTIKPTKPVIRKPVAAKKAITVNWTKGKRAQVTGYEVVVATDQKFSKDKQTVTVKGYKHASKKVAKLKAKKTYYVKARTYKTVKGIKIYSDWSAVKTVKTK